MKSYTLLLLFCVGFLPSCRSYDDSSISTDGLEAEGASNTRGVGATFPLEVRIVHHLRKNNIDIKKTLNGKKVLFSVDYYFPTNFPQFNDDAISEDELAEMVRVSIDDLFQRFDYVLIQDLFVRTDLKPDNQATLAKNSSVFLPLITIENALSKTELLKRKTLAVNAALDEYAKANPRLMIIPSREFFNKIIEQTGYFEDGWRWSIKPSALFAKDYIHANDAGQAAFFNNSLKKYLMRVPEFKSVALPNMKVDETFGSAWRKDILKIMAGTIEEFKKDVAKDYWGRVVNVKNFYAKASSISKDLSPESHYDINELKGIQSTIGNLVFIGATTSEHYVSLGRSNDGRAILSLDLSKTIFFTNLDLYESAPGSDVFTGYGYDYWSSVSGSPSVNYKFTATRNKNDRSLIAMKWQLAPMLVDPNTKEKQAKQLLRVPLTDQKWIKVWEDHAKKIPTLEYNYQLKIVEE